jgi:S1-C subfamily serine protease
MSTSRFTCRDGSGALVEPHTAIFPILKEVTHAKTRLVGTGFFITMLGHFVTAKHVVQDAFDKVTGEQTGFLHAVHFVESSQILNDRARIGS